MNNFANTHKTVSANELMVGDKVTSKVTVKGVIVNEDGSVDVKWSNSPRVQHYPAGRTVLILK